MNLCLQKEDKKIYSYKRNASDLRSNSRGGGERKRGGRKGGVKGGWEKKERKF